MTLTPKLEVLGQLSERARELEDSLDCCPDCDFFEALLEMNRIRHAKAPWPDLRGALMLVLAIGVNRIVDGDKNQPFVPFPDEPSTL
jgi:hypothetical protein